MKSRISIRLAIALIAMIGCVLAAVRWYDPAVRYRRDHDQASLHTVLSRRVSNGDSIVEVESLLGRGSLNTDPKLRLAALTIDGPQGVEADDEFREFQCGPGVKQILQFREGRLVNFDPTEFKVHAATVSRVSK